MNKNLLQKTQRAYLYFLILLFVIIAPLFYIIAHHLYVGKVDESLILAKTKFMQRSVSKLKIKDIATWNSFNYKIKIEKYKALNNDTLFNTSFCNFSEKEIEPIRELNSPVVIGGKNYTLSVKANLLESEDSITTLLILF
ncbi:MAG: hypothetical protein JJE45_08775, partial [Prolixibacteraceae bacterium]|nr:hypothetical protein [Prolixibacteraceae bacterium]